jgi:hypothetical protein
MTLSKAVIMLSAVSGVGSWSRGNDVSKWPRCTALLSWHIFLQKTRERN